MPTQHEQFGFRDIARKVKSDIISLSFFGTNIVVLGSMDAATDLLEKRATIYSNRFAPPMIVSPAGLDMRNMMTIMNPNELWRKYRKAMHSWLNKQAVVNFSESQELQFLLTDSPWHFSLLGSITYPSVRAIVLYISCLGSDFLINLIPWLQYVPEWLPGTGWKRVARDWREHKERTFNGIYQWTKQRVIDGVDDYSIIASTLRETKMWGWDEKEIDEFSKHLGMVLYMGGTDTSVSALVTFVLAMVLFPETQTKAQQEIDSITGKNRLPTLKDRPRLPYVERLISEVLRWQPVSPLGVPHVTAREDVYRGYRIPKDTILFGNIWAMSRDERVYADPETFNPDRYLDGTVPVLPAFGWGSYVQEYTWQIPLSS
ncbi:unnamed protein product [Rhizoctonia solani]|uniref:O-methylsterigmatocystin oxidoreductase n=1 Tax=Rhizoctonia solani TaxID=456999 RepID=A0A8H3A474_9AGAM|nr:unnamed protein product [Rhizoctonia solani]